MMLVFFNKTMPVDLVYTILYLTGYHFIYVAIREIIIGTKDKIRLRSRE